MEPQETQSLVRLEGSLTVSSAAELKCALLEGLAFGKDLTLDLEQVKEMDVTAMQLLWAAGHDAARAGLKTVSRLSDTASKALRDAGFEPLPRETLPA